MNFEPGFIQCSDSGFRHERKLAHIELDSASFAYLNTTFEKTCKTAHLS